MNAIARRWTLALQARRLPAIDIDLQLHLAANADPYYAQLTREFAINARRRRPPLIGPRRGSVGVAVCRLHPTFDAYFMAIEAAARRNVKKALKLEYSFSPILYNDWLAGIQVIRRSTDTRQGKLSEQFLSQELKPCPDPEPKTKTHGYPYFGIVRDGVLAAFGGGLLAGEVFFLEQLYGHADYLADGVTPLLIVEIARHLFDRYPSVRFYAYGGYLGATPTMQRFKKKFLFVPHRVRWRLK